MNYISSHILEKRKTLVEQEIHAFMCLLRSLDFVINFINSMVAEQRYGFVSSDFKYIL